MRFAEERLFFRPGQREFFAEDQICHRARTRAFHQLERLSETLALQKLRDRRIVKSDFVVKKLLATLVVPQVAPVCFERIHGFQIIGQRLVGLACGGVELSARHQAARVASIE